MPQKNLQIAMFWIAAFNEKKLDQLIALYDNDAQHFSPKLKQKHPETNGLIIGKNALKNWWLEAFETLPTLHYKVTSLTANSDRIFMEYTRQVENEDDLAIAEVLHIKDGKIVASRVYHG